MKTFVLITIVVFALTGCFWEDELPENTVSVSHTPVNLSPLNTEFDDYNSNYDPGEGMYIIFSSNRNSEGKDYDLVFKGLYFLEDPESGLLTCKVDENNVPDEWEIIFRNINSDKNEFGPFITSTGGNLLFMYSTEKAAGYDIQFLDVSAWYAAKYKSFDTIPKCIPEINEYGDDLYSTISMDKKNLIFCSNKDGNDFNIYQASFESEISSELLAKGKMKTIEKIEALSGIADDKCPFIGKDNRMVFASNRKGGYGGYDLWYSLYENGEWTEPKNFGNKVNSKEDEFRPITFSVLGYNLMIFSSNRGGGKGGFDLYTVDYGNL